MKIQNKKKTPKTALVIVLIVAIVLVGGAVYWYLKSNNFFDHHNDTTKQQSGKDNSQNTTNTDNNGTTDNTTNNDNKGSDEKTPVEADNSGKKVAQITIVDASQYDNMFEVRAGMNNITEDSGTCNYTFTQNGQVLNYSSDAIFTGTGTDCKTIDIPVSDFPAKGAWQLVITYSSATATGTSATKTVTVK